VPATPQDNYAMMRAAIRAEDPVVYMEHKSIWTMEGEVEEDAPFEWGTARDRTQGEDLTIVAWSDTANVAERAAGILAGEGVGAHVIDLRTLWPWDKGAVIASVRRTGRLIVAHEAVRTGGFGGEVVATVTEAAWDALIAPPRRLGAPRSLIPYAPNLEEQLRVTEDMIADAAREMLA
jgi:pyruvate dehydrogenase E1 component beta subunit